MELTEELLGIERGLWDANVAGDGDFYDRLLRDDAIAVSPWGTLDKAAAVAGVTANQNPYTKYELDQVRSLRLGADNALLTYRAAVYSERGRHVVYATTVYVHDGERWRGAFHQQSLLADQGS